MNLKREWKKTMVFLETTPSPTSTDPSSRSFTFAYIENSKCAETNYIDLKIPKSQMQNIPHAQFGQLSTGSCYRRDTGQGEMLPV